VRVPGLGPAAESPSTPLRTGFCFGKRTQNHVGRDMALRVPCAVHRLLRPCSGQARQRANSPGSNTARLFSGAGCTARPCHQARKSNKEVEITAQGSGKGRQLIGASLPRPSGRRWAIGEDFFRGSMKKSDMRQDCRNGGEGKGC
jgi:hypothetical protein